MLRNFILAGVLALFSLAPAWCDPAMKFHSVKLQLPAGDGMLPGGDNANAVNNNCLACHSAEMILDQPALTKTAWSAEVHKMIATYKAPVSAADANAVIAYLAETKGQK
jgi:hypothetical protein